MLDRGKAEPLGPLWDTPLIKLPGFSSDEKKHSNNNWVGITVLFASSPKFAEPPSPGPIRSPISSKVRVVGGAYGGFCGFDPRSGDFKYLSYRDPNLGQTLETYDGAPGIGPVKLGTQGFNSNET